MPAVRIHKTGKGTALRDGVLSRNSGELQHGARTTGSCPVVQRTTM